MRKMIFFAFALAGLSATAFPADRQIAFERDNAVYVANLDGTNEKKIVDGIFPAISPDGTRVAFNTAEKTSETTYVRLIYRMSFDRNNAKLLVKGGRTPSVSAP